MKISVVTANYNGAEFLEQCLKSVISQRSDGFDLEYIVVDGESTDGSLDIINRFKPEISQLIVGKDEGPFDAINKGLSKASGDILCWLNSDDYYCSGALQRVADVMKEREDAVLCFGHCSIVDKNGSEIRKGITRFKEFFYPFSSRFTLQCLNYISQPAMFFRKEAFQKTGGLRRDLKCAWDYDLLIKLFRQGKAAAVKNPPLACFRWHPSSLSGSFFKDQFREEWEVAVQDAGRFSLQALLHLGVWGGIVSSYTIMKWMRSSRDQLSEDSESKGKQTDEL